MAQKIVLTLLSLRQQIIGLICNLTTINNFKDGIYLIIELKLASIVTNWFSDKFLLWIMMNVIIFYGPIDKWFPGSIPYTFISIRQTIEGVYGIIEILIPKYVDEETKKEKESTKQE